MLNVCYIFDIYSMHIYITFSIYIYTYNIELELESASSLRDNQEIVLAGYYRTTYHPLTLFWKVNILLGCNDFS